MTMMHELETPTLTTEMYELEIPNTSTTDEYLEEERNFDPNCSSIKGYSAKPILEQINCIAEIFELNPAQALAYSKKLPELGLGQDWYAVPSVSAIAKKHFPKARSEEEKIVCATNLILKKIGKLRKISYTIPELGSFWTHPRTKRVLDYIAKEQDGDILLIAAQLGPRHGGCSIRRTNKRYSGNEYGLTSVMVGSIALVHPILLKVNNCHRINCPGDIFKKTNRDVTRSLHFGFYWMYGDVLNFDDYPDDHDHVKNRPATGFIYPIKGG